MKTRCTTAGQKCRPRAQPKLVRITPAIQTFGTDGVRGRANAHPMTAETALRLGQAAGRLFRAARSRPGGDRQGHPALGLHDRERAAGGLHLGGA
jgi:hypothetical protein